MRSISNRLPVAMILFVLAHAVTGCNKAYRHVQIAETPANEAREKRALLVMPGLGFSRRGMRAAKRWYPTLGYDVYIPEYQSDLGFRGHIAKLRAYIEQQHLEAYKEVYAFTYLLGGWTLNQYLKKYPMHNLKKIVYDRSPYQEQAPRIVTENLPRLMRLLFGITVHELRDTLYPPIEKGDRRIGIIVECRATPYVRWNREQLRPLSDRDWRPDAFHQPHDDLIYTSLHHKEMYRRFDIIGDELRLFFETGSFSEHAPRKHLDIDPFD